MELTLNAVVVRRKVFFLFNNLLKLFSIIPSLLLEEIWLLKHLVAVRLGAVIRIEIKEVHMLGLLPLSHRVYVLRRYLPKFVNKLNVLRLFLWSI